MRRILFPLAATLLSIASAPAVFAQAPSPLPAIVQHDGRFALMVDGAPYLMLGVQVNNSSA